MSKTAREIQFVIDLLDEAFQSRSWHGTNLRGSVRGLSAKQAAWKPAKNRKCIWEHVLHTAYWKYVVRRRFLGEERGGFPIKGSNWFPVPSDASERAWRAHLALLADQHARLVAAIRDLRPIDLTKTPPDSKVSNAAILRGIACHDLYHTGQIQLLKRLQGVRR